MVLLNRVVNVEDQAAIQHVDVIQAILTMESCLIDRVSLLVIAFYADISILQ